MSDEKNPAVYIMASRYRGTLYTGVTSDLWQRVWDHKYERYSGFTKDYVIKTLVWYEHHHEMEDAIRRKKQIKKWNRPWKFCVTEEMNKDWLDLHDTIDLIATLIEKKAWSPPSRA